MRSSVEYDGTTIVFEIEHRHRKTMAIHIKPPGIVKVFAPVGSGLEMIRERVRSKGGWILKKLSEASRLDPGKYKKDFVDGENFLFLGRGHDLRIVKNGRKIPKVFLRNRSFWLETSVCEYGELKKAMEKWYRKKAQVILEDRAGLYAEKTGKFPRSVKAKQQKKRWGSCTSRGDLYFNWRLAMAPPGIIDYIVVHELCHLVQPDHSRRFWQRVEKVLPDYKKRKKWLGENGHRLDM